MNRSASSRVLSAILALIMVISMIPFATFAADDSATYTKITSADELTTGKYVMVADNGYAPTVLDGSWILAEAVTATDGKITSPAANLVWTITVDGTTVKLTDSNGVTVAPKSGNTNGIQSDDYDWAVTCADETFQFFGQGSDTTVLASNKGSANKFRAYKTSTVSGNPGGYPSFFTLYKLDESDPTDPPATEEPDVTISTIAEAVAAAEGEFTVKGVVTLIDGKNLYVQDATGGICVRMNNTPSDVALGDTIIGTGAKSTYKGLPQLGSGTYEKSEGLTLTAKETTISGLTTADICTYVSIKGVEVTEVYDKNGEYTSPNITVTDGINTIQIYKAVVGKTDGAWNVKVGDKLDILAAVGVNNTTLQLRNTLASEITVHTTTTPDVPEEPEDPYKDIDAKYSVYELVDAPAAGDTVILFNAGNSKILTSTATSYYRAGVDAAVTGNLIATDAEAIEWVVGEAESETGKVYTFTQGDMMLASVASGDFFNLSTETTDATGWTLDTCNEENKSYYVYSSTLTGQYGNVYLEWYANKDAFTAYCTGADRLNETNFGFQFYKLVREGVEEEQPEDPIEPPVEPYVAYAEKMNDLPNDGDTIIIYNSGNAMGSAANGAKLSAVAAEVTEDKLPIADTMAQLLVTIDEDGNYLFTLDGKYLTSADTGNGLSFAAELTDCGKWTIQAATNGTWYIKNVGANYNGSYNQALEYYSGFTTYGIKETPAYQMELFLVKAAAAESGKITSADQFVTGTYAMVVEGGYAMGILDGTWVSVVQPAIEGDTVTDAKGGIWTLTVNGSSVQITDSNGVSIKPKGGNSNGISSGSYDWAWSFDEATQTFVFAGTGSDTVKLASNASEDAQYGGFHRFRGYKNTTISGNPSTYPCNFTLYRVEESEGPASDLPAAGDQVVIYNLNAKGVLAAENDTESIENVLAEIVDGKAVPGNGGVVFTVEMNGNYYRFHNETYGYLCSYGTGNNAVYREEVSEDADWTLEKLNGGYKMLSRTAKYNGTSAQYLEYYADSYKTYSFYATNKDGSPADTSIYEFYFYGIADGLNVTGGIVNNPGIDFGTLYDAYVGAPYTFSFTVDAVFGVDGELTVMVGETALTANEDGTYTIPAELITGESLTITVTGTDTKGVAISGTATVTVKDEPVIGDVTPAANAQTFENKKPVISAVITNAGEDAEIVMTINGEAVAAVFENGVLSYTPVEDMADGRTTVTVTVTRADGKTAEKVWSFTVGQAQFQLYFGQLHSHTTYSDGSGSLESALEYIASLPESANVDFVAFTDHSNYFDASGAANPEAALYDMSVATAASQKLWAEYVGAMKDFNAKQSDVIAVPGFEMTWSGGPGHINTFNTPGIVSRNNTTLNNKTADAGMKAYYALLSQPEGADSISQFNHPGSTFGTFTDFAYWDAVVDTRIQLVEVGNGEGQIGAGGYYPSYEYYTMALDKGWHVAPTNNQDNHKGKWGNANDARDVIITDDFSEEGIYAAIRAMRMYATEDKNLEIGYTVNGQMLGSTISEVPEKLNIDVTVYDPDASDSISKVEVIVNSGKVAYTWSDPADLADGALSVELDPDYSYYYIRVTEGDGDLAVTAPVWVGEMLKLGISAVETATSTPVTDEELTITTTLFNSENKDAVIKSMTYTLDGTVLKTVDNPGTIPASGTVSVDYQYTPTTAKVQKLAVTAVVEQDGTEYTFSMDITLDVQDASKLVYIGIDASHYNEYVNGNYKDSMGNFSNLAAEYNVRTVTLYESADLIAACGNDKYVALILTAPSRRSGEAQAADPLKVYTAEELAAINAFNEKGGTVILAGWSDHYENYPDVASIAGMAKEEHMAATQNAVLEALGSSLRIGDDATYDDDYNGGQAYRLYFNSYNFDNFLVDGVEVDPEHPHDRMYTEVFSHYGGASVYTVDGKLPTTVSPVVFGHSGTYSVDVDKDGLGGEGMPKYAYAEGDKRLMIMATEQLEGRGLIIVSGAAFMSNFEVQATIEDSGSEKNYSNYRVCENLLAYLNPVSVTTIAKVRAQTEVGYKYTIEGIVTSNASGYDKDTAFFDCIYVQDATGGICCFPVAGNYKIGDQVRITGTTEFYQGEPELQVSSITVIGKGTVEATEITASQLNDRSAEGKLVTISGTVESFELANGLVQTIMVKDAEGNVARIFIDGYITTRQDVQNLVKGYNITATGLASYDNTFEGPFPRIRIRNRADIVCTEPVHTHDYKATVTEPTCTEGGYTTYTCACGDSYTGDETPALGHNVVLKEEKAPGCETYGYEYHACERCGGEEYQIMIDPIGHNYEDGICTGCGQEDPNASKPGTGSWISNLIGKWFDKWFGCDDDEPTVPPTEPEVPSEPSEPSVPEKPGKPGWGFIWDWIFWWK